jgi:TPR repeat protein
VSYADAVRAIRRGDPTKARIILARVAEAGDAKACSLLAQLFSFGHGGRADPTAAARWYEKAAQAGDAASCVNLGVLHAIGKGVPQSWARAREWYLRGAELGDVEALVRLGLMAAEGQGAAPDLDEAEKHWRSAAAKDHPVAMLDLGRLLVRRGGERVGEGAHWALEAFLNARDKDLAGSAAGFIGSLRPELERLAGEGSGAAAFALGGIAMLEERVADAARSFEAAATTGHIFGQRSLAFLLETGQGVEADLPRAVDLYRRAAEGGDVVAQLSFATLLHRGEGVARDVEAALAWATRAAAQGDAVARRKLADWLAELGRHAEAARWLKDGAEAGDPRAMLRLADLLVDGRGVERDLIQAARWCFAPMAKGNGDGIHKLHGFVKELTADQLRQAAAAAGDETLADAAIATWIQPSG